MKTTINQTKRARSKKPLKVGWLSKILCTIFSAEFLIFFIYYSRLCDFSLCSRILSRLVRTQIARIKTAIQNIFIAKGASQNAVTAAMESLIPVAIAVPMTPSFYHTHLKQSNELYTPLQQAKRVVNRQIPPLKITIY